MNKEVKKRVIISVTTELIKANGGAGRNSAGKANTKTLSSPSNSDEKHLPHYLRASTGSCHDFCKYGRKHAFDAKERRPILPTFLGNEIPDEEHHQAKVVNLRERRKRPVPKLKTTSQMKVVVSDKPKYSDKKGLSPTSREGSCGKLVRANLSASSPLSRSPESTEHLLHDHDEELSDELISIKVMKHSPDEKSIISDGNKLSIRAGGSSEQPISVKLMMPSPMGESFFPDENTSSSQAGGITEETINLKPEIPSTMNANTDFADSEPANLAEGSLEKQVDMNLQAPLDEQSIIPAHDTLANGAEGSSNEPVMIKVTSPPSIQRSIVSAEPTPSDEEGESSEGSMNMELETPPSIKISSGDGEHISVTPAEESFREPLSMKVKTPSTTKKPLASRKHISTKLTTPSLIRKNRAFSEHTVTQTQNGQDQLRGPNIGEIKKKQVIKLKSAPPPKTEFSDQSKVLKQKEIDASGKTGITLQKTLSPVKKTMTANPIRQKSLSSVKTIVSFTKPSIIEKKTSSSPSRKDVSPRSSILLKPKVSVVKSAPLLVSSGGLTGRKKLQNKVPGSVELPKIGEEKPLKPLRASLCPKPSASGVSSTKLRKDRNAKPATPVENQGSVGKEEEGNEIIEEKTLYIVSSKQVKNGSKSAQQKLKNNRTYPSARSSHGKEEVEDDSESIYSKVSEPIMGNDGSKSKKQDGHSKGQDKKRLGRAGNFHPEAEIPAPRKLNFRRGKVVNLQSEYNGPRRLRFRQARLVIENQNGKSEAEKRSFRRGKDSGGAGSNESNESRLEPPAVVLRRQGQQEKKETQGLFNHVIEETASKLVETRKSKVKALVGAFETVISLQESKVAPTV